MKNKVSKEIEAHTARMKEIQPMKDWEEWLERWPAARTFEEMLGLIRVGFDVPLGDKKDHDEIDRLIFYFAAADGRYIDRSPAKDLMTLAFSKLCKNLFEKNMRSRVIASERLFQVVQNFFRPEPENDYRIRNICHFDFQRTTEDNAAIRFLESLVDPIWDWEKWDARNSTSKTRNSASRIARLQRVNASKPWIVEVLAQLDEFDTLEWRASELDTACRAKLKEIALRSSFDAHLHPVTENRQAATIDEACYLHSPAAWLLKKHALLVKEHKRLVAAHKKEKNG